MYVCHAKTYKYSYNADMNPCLISMQWCEHLRAHHEAWSVAHAAQQEEALAALHSLQLDKQEGLNPSEASEGSACNVII